MKPAARRRARECAVQALYSWQLSQNDIADVEYQFLSEQDVKDVDVLYFRELLSGVATNSAYLDGLMKPYLSRLLEELGAITTDEQASAYKLTPLGRQLSQLPVDPRLARMVL